MVGFRDLIGIAIAPVSKKLAWLSFSAFESYFFSISYRYESKMRQTEERMRALGLLTPSCVLTLDEWEIPRDRVVINRKLGEGAFGTVYGGEAFFDEKGWVSTTIFQSLELAETI